MRFRTTLILGIVVCQTFSFRTNHPFAFENWVRAGHGVVNVMGLYARLPYVPGMSFPNDFGNGKTAALARGAPKGVRPLRGGTWKED
jgi:hypothetical protein